MEQNVKVVKLQLAASPETFRSLDGQSKICNWLYNRLLEKANALKVYFKETSSPETVKILYTERGLRNLLPSLKEELPFLKSVHSSPLKNTALRLSQAIRTHQKSRKGQRKGEQVGWPGFRSWQADWFSLFYDEPAKGFKVNQNRLDVSLGAKVSLSFLINDHELLKNRTIRNLRIVKQAGYYYAVFTVLSPLPEKKPIKRIIAFDPNHKNMAYGADIEGKGIEIASSFWLKKTDKRIDELTCKRDRCLKKSTKQVIVDLQGNPVKERFLPSRRRIKYQKTLEKVRHKRQEQTKVFVYTLAHEICKNYDAIAIGDYTPKGEGTNSAMRRAMNNRSLIGRFKETLRWVAAKSGKLFIEYNEAGTTRTCNRCNYVHPEGLHPSIRTWNCPGCCHIHERDENSAINGLKKILRDLKEKGEASASQVPCSGLFQVTERWAWRVLPSGVQKTLRGPDSEISQRQEIKREA